ncbi:MAG: S46 family peptidase [Bryobacteraceae bacterium]
MRLIIAVISLLPTGLALADDGIWLLDQPPVERIAKEHGFRLTGSFLDKLRRASVRLVNGGSASMVSSDGLIFTNHHVAAECIQKLSTPERDLMKNGFLAPARAAELPCPDYEANILEEITDVTAKVTGAAPEGTASAEANRLRKAAMTAIEQQCQSAGGRCDVVTLYAGGLYHLYRYRKYTDIRLVFAPEVSIAAFGGDPDNFTYPRYCLDMSFLRAWENGKPAATPNFLKWSRAGARKGELIFVTGHPGTTGRLETVAALEFFRDHTYPFQVDYLESIIAALARYSAERDENRRVAQENLFSQQNSFKAFTGFLAGLRDPSLMARKRDDESTLATRAGGDFNQTLAKVSATYKNYEHFYRRYYLLERLAGRGSDLYAISRQVLRYGVEKTKPDAERLREYTTPALESLEQAMYTPAPVTASQEIAVLANYLDFLQKQFGAGDALVRRLLEGKSPQSAAEAYVGTSRLMEVAERKRLANDPAAAAQSSDGMLRLVRAIDGEARRYRKRFEDEVEAPLSEAAASVARARFQAFGTGDYPDATFTLRLSYGPVAGYRDAQGREVPWTTTIGGVFPRATGKEPFALPPSWLAARGRLTASTPFNFVTTADTHGGNSGSPTVNRKGEVVGILFDGNIESLPNRFVYRDERERSVHVASQGIIEALRKVYKADALVKELFRSR